VLFHRRTDRILEETSVLDVNYKKGGC